MRGGLGCYVTILVVGTIIITAKEASHWVLSGGHPNRRKSAEVVAEASRELLQREAAIRTLRVKGTMQRETRGSGADAWNLAGESTADCVYEFGPAGRARVACSGDLPAPQGVEQGGAPPFKAFTAVYDLKAGATVGRPTNGAGNSSLVMLERGRPAIMEVGDETSAWHYAFYGRWMGGGDSGEVFSNVLDGTVKGILATGEDVDPEMTPSLLITLTRADRIEKYWLNINMGYMVWLWEEHENAGDGKPGRLLQNMRVKDLWVLSPELYYPRHVEVTRMNAREIAVERESIEVTDVATEPATGGNDKMAVNVPAGAAILRVGATVEQLEGSAQENTKAVADRLRALEQ